MQNVWEQDTTGRYVAPFDKDAERVIPVDLTKVLADIGFGYASHTVIADAGLELVGDGEHANGVVFVRVRCAPAVTVGSLQKLVVRFVTTDGQRDDVRLHLRITD